MLEFVGINIGAILVTWIIYMAVGGIWYSPVGFAKKWQKYTGIDIMKIPTQQANRILLSVALSSLVQAITLAVIVKSVGATTVLEGLVVGVVLWLGLTTATTVGVTLYSKLSWKFLWLNSAYFFVVMSVGSIIFAVWK
jgi:hypothetical protein